MIGKYTSFTSGKLVLLVSQKALKKQNKFLLKWYEKYDQEILQKDPAEKLGSQELKWGLGGQGVCTW